MLYGIVYLALLVGLLTWVLVALVRVGRPKPGFGHRVARSDGTDNDATWVATHHVHTSTMMSSAGAAETHHHHHRHTPDCGHAAQHHSPCDHASSHHDGGSGSIDCGSSGATDCGGSADAGSNP